MAISFLKGLFKSYSEKEINKLKPTVDKILDLEKDFEQLTDAQLRSKTEEFKGRLAQGETLDDILVEAFATVREAAWRVLGLKPYPVQVLGGIILHQGKIAEMKTGEGKTLVATLPAYLNALEGKGVHVVTVNDYLAQRDKDQMGKIYRFLGLTVGNVIHGLSERERQEAYRADITYATNNQLGFDYLRDNMEIHKEDTVQRGLHFAIVDEVDSILIDEARTPLIISGQGQDSTDMYQRADQFVRSLTGRILDPEETEKNKLDSLFEEHELETVDFVVDEKRKSATLTEQGNEKAEKFFSIENLSDPENMELIHHINQALKARNTMHRDIDYVIKDDEVLIVDEFTGRIMEGRRYSDGLHQAIEAKEGVSIKSESKTLATITFQNFFRMYDKLSGMTGTAMTEKDEFAEIYNLDSIEIPTNEPVIREDENDRIYVTEKAKFDAVVDEIKEIQATTKQPILVGTVSIEKSEYLSKLLKKERIVHEVLNAKQHQREAEIVAQAGVLGKITIATNMAGRGTDIVLGGNPEYLAKKEMKKEGFEDYLIDEADGFAETDDQDILDSRDRFQELKAQFKKATDENAKEVVAAGGLMIIGTERHESRRIDNQLRGRSGRQGDPGRSRFYISLEDDLMRLFGGQALNRFSSFPEDEPIEAKLLSTAIEKAQGRVESNNFAMRKRVLEYDNVMNKQREVIYGERNQVLNGDDIHENIMNMLEGFIFDTVDSFANPSSPRDQWEIEGLKTYLSSICIPNEYWHDIELTSQDKLKVDLLNIAKDVYASREENIGSDQMRELERIILLKVVDSKWVDHIDAMDQLKQSIGARALGNEDPVRAYANEGYDMFNELNTSIREDTIKYLFHVEPTSNLQREKVVKENEAKLQGREDQDQPVQRIVDRKIGRNDPCPCGSGKKYKNCHGR